MKVKLKNVLPNPFRDMDNYPIHPQKVKSSWPMVIIA